jgi:hypothetical protein
LTAGYSGTPLAKKLGFKPGQHVWFSNMPDAVRAEIDPPAIGLVELPTPGTGLDAAHLFVTRHAVLETEIARLRDLIAPNGMIWVSWPKKAAKTDTDITEQTIRDVALPTGLVDVKVCAIDEKWSGLKLVVRKALRTA